MFVKKRDVEPRLPTREELDMYLDRMDEDLLSLTMTGVEADMLMFALTQCDSPAANVTLSAMADFLGYKVALKDGMVPELVHTANVTVVTLHQSDAYGLPVTPLARLQVLVDAAAKTPEVFERLEKGYKILAIKALRVAIPGVDGIYVGLKEAKDAVDMLSHAYDSKKYTYADAISGKIKFNVEA